MHRWFGTAVAVAAAFALPASAGASQGSPSPRDAYHAKVGSGQLERLKAAGVDVTGSKASGGGFEVDLVLDAKGRDKLRAQGIEPKLTRVKGGKTVRQFAAEQAASGYQVWRSWDEPGGFRDQLYQVARDNPQIAKLVKLGTTYQGRELLAIKLTQGARGQADGSRPAAIYSATQHAREWIAPEVDRRLMNWYIDRWRKNDKDVKNLLKDTELWFFPVMNPDGYQYTFDSERLWRKNLRDNDGNGEVNGGDGVDPNRNYPEHWGYDNEGSSGDHVERDLPRSVAGFGAGDEGDDQAARHLAGEVPGQLPLQRPLAAVPGGLADRLADDGRPDLLRAVGQPRQAGDRRLPPRAQLGRALRHQR